MIDAAIPDQLVRERRLTRVRWLVPCLLLAGMTASLWIDVPIATVFNADQLPRSINRPLREGLEICEAFGHGFGATLIIVAVGVLDPLRKRSLVWVVAGSLGAGIIANSLKVVLRRARPRDFQFSGGSVWHTFADEFSRSAEMQSFPSAHTATAVGLAVMLTSLYPRGRVFFSVLAILVGMQRIVSSAHFPSDVFAGAAVGWLVATVCVASMSSRREPLQAVRSR